MKQPKASLLLHSVFIVSLLVLFCNDFYWKYMYGNWLTGKLSDVAGLIVLLVFLREIFPKLSKGMTSCFCALFFLWWKSPLSQPAIDVFTNNFNIPLHRTIDYTDLFATAVLPFACKLQPTKLNINYLAQKGLTYLLGFASIFSLCSTSCYRYLPYSQYSKNEVRYTQEFCSAKTVEEMLQGLRNKGIVFSEESVRYYPLNQDYSDLFYRIPVNDSTFKWQPVSTATDSIVYVQKRLYPPNFLIESPQNFEGEILKNIRFRILPSDSKKKRSCVEVLSFETDNGTYDFLPDKKQKKQLKKIFEELFNP